MPNVQRLASVALVIALISSIALPSVVRGQNSLDQYAGKDLTTTEVHDILSSAKARGLEQSREAAKQVARMSAVSLLNYDVKFYDVNIRVNDTTEILYGVVKMVAEATQDGVSEIEFDLNGTMPIDSIVDPSGLLSYTPGAWVQTVDLGATYNTGEQFEIEITYHGHPIVGSLQAFSFETWFSKKLITSLSQPYSAHTWWPCKDRMDDKPDSMAIAFQVDTSFFAASNGTLDSTIYNGDNTNTFYYTVHYPMATYLLSIALYDYQVWYDEWVYNEGVDTMLLINASYPYLYTSSLTAWGITPDVLTTLSNIFGEYPFAEEKYGHAHWQWGGAMEHQTMTSALGGSFGFREDVIVHEAGHQWFGDMITCKSWHDIWLNEGWASYCEAAYFLEKDGWEFYQDYMNSMAYTGGLSVWCPDTTDVNRIFSTGASYNKGAWVVHMLRGVLGETAFAKLLVDYYNSEYRHAAISTDEFRDLAELSSGVELNWFFEDWVYGTYRPDYAWSYWSEPADGGGYDIYLHVEQIQISDPLVFRSPVDFVVQYSSGPDDTLVLVPDERSKYLTAHVDNDPVAILLDPRDWVLKWETAYPWTLKIITPDGDIGDGVRKQAYLDTVQAKGGSGDLAFSISGGVLPDGFSLTGDGIISGLPTVPGTFVFSVRVDDNLGAFFDEVEYSVYIDANSSGVAGDANDDGNRNISDITFLVDYLFGVPLGASPPTLAQADMDATCTINISDVTYMVDYLFGIPIGAAPLDGCVSP